MPLPSERRDAPRVDAMTGALGQALEAKKEPVMTVRVAINGFGRIGRMVLRAIVESDRKDITVVAINDLAPPETNAHLLRFDSIHGRFPGEVTVKGDTIDCGIGPIKVLAIRDPAQLPRKELAVDIALECTGLFVTKEKASAHLTAGAKRVIISAPADGVDLTVVYGVNHDKLTAQHVVISNASCTTNCLGPVVKVLHEKFGIEKGSMTTIHSYTNDQRILDLPHKDLRRARAAALSMIPTTTGAAKALREVLPAMAGKLDGWSIRVPTPDVSLVDLTVKVEKKADVKSVNDAFREAAAGALKGILAVSDEPLVSCDFIGDRHSAILDSALTTVVGDTVKVMAWYDNEMGYAQRTFDLARFVAGKL
jgi:glyceraldehyde 3-phosphate dehydrogenase